MSEQIVFAVVRLGVWTLALVAMSGLVVLVPTSLAQTSTTGTVAGVVTDSSGAVVPQAAVELSKVNTNAARSATELMNFEYLTSVGEGPHRGGTACFPGPPATRTDLVHLHPGTSGWSPSHNQIQRRSYYQ